MTETTLQETFHGTGVRAVLSDVDGRCLFEVDVRQAQMPHGSKLKLEVLFQTRDQRGLPRGAAVVVYFATICLHDADDGSAHGFSWLPRSIGPDLAGQCHYRLTPLKMCRTSPE